jgi:hypothetical protein
LGSGCRAISDRYNQRRRWPLSPGPESIELFYCAPVTAVWPRPFFTREGKVLGDFAFLDREVRNPDAVDLQLIENASHIARIAIEQHLS